MTLAEKGWAYIRLINYRQNIRRVMLRHNAVYAPPPRRWRCWAGGIFREHEYYLRASRLLELDQGGTR